jgi:hypothetical protein
LISIDGENPPALRLNPELLEMRLDYSFVSDMGETFEAELTGKGIITNEDMIPAGIKISTESFVVGVVIRESRGNEALNLERALLKENNITGVLNGYLKVTLLVNLALLLLYYFVSLVIVEYVTVNLEPRPILATGWANIPTAWCLPSSPSSCKSLDS